MITKTLPADWKDLQNKVAEILNQSNFLTEIEYTLFSVRGSYAIDIYAEENVDDRKYKIVCECKFWKSNIPQNVILALRSIINDTGVENGYIITTSDFQKGSYESSNSTNIHLLTWDEFQRKFFKSWYSNFFYKKLNYIIDTKYSSVNFQFYENFEVIDKNEFMELRDKYLELNIILHHFPSPYIAKIFPQEFKNIYTKLPLIKNLKMDTFGISNLLIPSDILNETHYQEFLGKIEKYARPINEKIQNLDLEIIDLE